MLKVRGYASIFGNVDSQNEVIDRGAFSGWIADNPGKSVPLFWSHAHKWDPLAMPIGKTTMIKQDRKGLYFEGEVSDTPEGVALQGLLKSGAVSGASFGFKTIDEYVKGGIVHKSVLHLGEISPATWGANAKAFVEAIPEKQESGNDHES